MDAGCFCVAGAALGAPQSHFAWQVQHLAAPPERSTEVRRQVSTMDAWSSSGSFCVAGAALGAPPERSAEVRRQAGRRLRLRGRCSTWSTSGSFCVAGAALGAPQAGFAWQLQRWNHLSCVLRGISLRLNPSTQHHLHYIIKHTIIKTTPSPQHHQHNLIHTTSSTHHHLHNTIYTTPSTLHHQHNTIYTTSSTQHHQYNIINKPPSSTHPHQHNTINTTPSTQPHQHITIYKTPSKEHHLHNTIYTTPSTQHHQHDTIYATSSNTGRCSTCSTAILALLPHSCWYPFCCSPLWIVLCSGSLAYSTVGCPKALLTCGVIRSYNASQMLRQRFLQNNFSSLDFLMVGGTTRCTTERICRWLWDWGLTNAWPKDLRLPTPQGLQDVWRWLDVSIVLGVPPIAGWFMMENAIYKWMITGGSPMTMETSIYGW